MFDSRGVVKSVRKEGGALSFLVENMETEMAGFTGFPLGQSKTWVQEFIKVGCMLFNAKGFGLESVRLINQSVQEGAYQFQVVGFRKTLYFRRIQAI